MMGKKRKTAFYRVAAFFLSAVMIANTIPDTAWAAAPAKITLTQAIDAGMKVSAEIRSADKKIYEKEVALKQARKAVGYARKKLQRLFEKAPLYDKAFDIETKVQKAEAALKIANRERVAAVSGTKYKVTAQYVRTYYAKTVVAAAAQTAREETEKQKLGKVKLSKGLIDQDTYKAQESLAQKKNEILLIAEADYESQKNKLSEICGIDMSNRDFDYSYKKAWLPQSYIKPLLQSAFDASSGLYSLNENIKVSSAQVNVSSRLYSNKFASHRLSGMQRLVSGGIANIEDLELIKSYDNLLNSLIAKWGDDWKSYYEIDLIFISIKIPKLFRFGEFDGVRYLEDSRYALMLSIVGTQQLIDQEKQLRKTLTEQVLALFQSINAKAMDYAVLQKQFDQLKREYDINQKKGALVEPDVLIAQKEQLEAMKLALAALLYDINAKAVDFDALTDGAYTRLLSSELVKNPNIAPAPFKRPSVTALTEALAKEAAVPGAIDGSWTLTTVAEGLTTALGLELTGAGSVQVKGYQVSNSDGQLISGIVPIKEPFVHLDVVFADRTDLILNLMDGSNKVIYRCTLDGYGEKGRIIVKK